VDDEEEEEGDEDDWDEDDNDDDDPISAVDDDAIGELQSYVEQASEEHPHLRSVLNALVEGHRRYHIVINRDGSQSTEGSNDPVEELADRVLDVMTGPNEGDKDYHRSRKTILSSRPFSMPQYTGKYSTEIYGQRAATIEGKRANRIVKEDSINKVLKPGFHCCDRNCISHWVKAMGEAEAKIAVTTERYAYASMSNIGRYEKYMGVIESNLEKVMVQPSIGGDKVVQRK